MASTKHVEKTSVVFNEEIATGIFMMTVNAPQIAASVEPGQFVHLRVVEHADQFLRMPFAVFDAMPLFGSVSIVYQVVGRGTRQLSKLEAGAAVDLIGPLGTGWAPPEGVSRALLVGGGAGAPALNLLCASLVERGARVDAVIGAVSADRLCCVDRFERDIEPCGGELHVTTDDGSYGTAGFVTAESDALIASGDYDYVAVCGPTPMMRSAVAPALANGTPCQVSLERLMACGVGACLSCVADTTAGRKRCCADGPVFDAREVTW